MYYTYGYFNPLKLDRFGQPTLFYVGKGQGDRVMFHLNQARKGKTDGNLHKYRTIKKILDAGLEPVIKVLHDDLSEEQAFELESFIIEQVGIDNLTNLTMGGEGITGYDQKQNAEKISKATREGMMKLDPEWRSNNAKNASLSFWGDMPEEERKVRTAHLQEYNHTEANMEHIQNLGKSRKGWKKTPEEIENFRKARTGILHSEQGLKNISEGIKKNERLMKIVTCPVCGKEGKLIGMFMHFKKCGVDATPYK